MTREIVITRRPESLPTETTKVRTGCGSLFITISKDKNCFEIDLHLGKAGSCTQAMLEVIRGLLTICRRQLNPIPRKLIIRQLDGIRCPTDSAFFPSCPQAICNVLKTEWGEEEKEERREDVESGT